MSPSPQRVRNVGIGAALFLVAVALVAPMLAYPFGRDQGVFACGADVLRRGGVLYRDFWDLKPPGIYYLYRLSFLLFGHSMPAPRIMDFIFTLATAAGLLLIGRRLVSLWAGVAAALAFLTRYALGFDYWHSAQGDGFASLFLTLAALAMLAAERRRSWRLAALGGLLVGAAILLKFTLGVFLLIPLVVVAVGREEKWAPRLSRYAACLLGCGLVVGAAIALVWRAGALRDMFEILLTWNAQYATLRAAGLAAPVAQTWRFLFPGGHPLLSLIGLFALAGLVDLARRREAGAFRWLPTVWLGLMLAQVYLQGKYFEYHWLPALPPLALLAGAGVAAAWRLLRERSDSPGTATGIAAAAALVLLAALGAGYRDQFTPEIELATGRISRAAFTDGFRDRQDFSLNADLQVATYLKQHTAPGSPVFIWGFEPIIYFLADRPPASRFISQQPLVTPWSPPAWREELLRDLAGKRPAYILVVHNDVMPWVTLRPDDSAGELSQYPALDQLLKRDYHPVETIEDFDIWQRGGGA